LQWVKILNTDGLVPLHSSPSTASFPFNTGVSGSSLYPLIYVPDSLFLDYIGDVETGTASKWIPNLPTVRVRIRPMSEFAVDFPGQ
jgi:hypothetical protein